MAESEEWLEASIVPLGQISTFWSDIRAAGGQTPAAMQAQRRLLERYYRPLLHFFQSRGFKGEAAIEVTHELIEGFLDGTLTRSADPQKGTYRKYLGVAAANLARSRWKEKKRRKEVPIREDRVEAPDLPPVEAALLDDEIAMETFLLARRATEAELRDYPLAWTLLDRYDLGEPAERAKTQQARADELGVDVHKVERELTRARKAFGAHIGRLLTDLAGGELEYRESVSWFEDWFKRAQLPRLR